MLPPVTPRTGQHCGKTANLSQSKISVTTPPQSLTISSETPGGRGPTTATSTFVADYGQVILYGSPTAQNDESDRSGGKAQRVDYVSGIGDRHQEGTTNLDRSTELVVEPSSPSISVLLFDAKLVDKERKGPARFFIPRRQLDVICNFDAVFTEIREFAHSDAEAALCAEYVCGPRESPSYEHFSSSRKIFATLVLIEKVQLIFEFQKAEIRDKHLPLRFDRDMATHWFSCGADDLSLRVFRAVLRRSPFVVSKFYEQQWSVHIPYIARDPRKDKPCDYQLDSETIMPWTEFPENVDSGGFGHVRRVEIHADHHGFPSNYRAFALKTFYQPNDRSKADFEREIKAFRKVPAVPHLVELCASFESSDGVYRLLFPWAAGGSLKSLWTNHLPTALFSHKEDISPAVFMHWLATQAHGLMSGLKTIHKLPEPGPSEAVDGKLYGIHGDLKPENILHFSQETDIHQFGTLKIADFGIVEFRSWATKTSPNEEWEGPASPTYRAPEHDLYIHQMMSRKVDIWSMGCVFSEMFTWALLGGNAVETYRDARMTDKTRLADPLSWTEDNFFCRTKGGRLSDEADRGSQYDTHIVKPSVRKWLADLIKLCSRPDVPHQETFCEEFLEFIRDFMLVPVREARVTCQDVIDFVEPRLKAPFKEGYWDCKLYEGTPSVFDSQLRNVEVHSDDLHGDDWTTANT